MTPNLPEPLERRYHQVRLKLGAGLHAFVRTEEEEARRRLRKFHAHVGVIFASWLATYVFTLTGIESAIVVTGSPALFLFIQECLDNVGKL